jgi:hypothetical protein
MDRNASRLKQLELLGGIGAGILGAGVALILAKWLTSYAIPILLIGIVAHGFAMFAKGRLERQSSVIQPWWAIAAEGACWVMILGLIGYITLSLLN